MRPKAGQTAWTRHLWPTIRSRMYPHGRHVGAMQNDVHDKPPSLLQPARITAVEMFSICTLCLFRSIDSVNHLCTCSLVPLFRWQLFKQHYMLRAEFLGLLGGRQKLLRVSHSSDDSRYLALATALVLKTVLFLFKFR